MVLSEEKQKKYMRRLLLSRMRILSVNGFYGLLIMHMKFALDSRLDTAATDGTRIYFGTEFLDSISDRELDFVLMHEVLHVVLQHCLRSGERDKELFNIACDIVVNSNILKSFHMDKSRITLKEYGESMHIAPDGKEGYEYTAEQVYAMLTAPGSPYRSMMGNAAADGKSSRSQRQVGGSKNKKQESDEAASGSASPAGKDHGRRYKNNSQNSNQETDGTSTSGKDHGGQRAGQFDSWDDHSKWKEMEEDEWLQDLWVKRLEDAAEAISVRDPSNQRGTLPDFAVRILKELKEPQTDWRTVLDSFVQEEIADYSFTPPDRRMADFDFFLPDFNDKEDMVSDILFMIDTSGSMSDDMVTTAYSEVKGAIDQFDGKLTGWLGFFDAGVTEPVPFSDEESFRIIKPLGGGGTDFRVIFEYVRRYMQDKLPASIIILTDGLAPFPKESIAMGIPVLWLLNNDRIDPPWGKVARITTEVVNGDGSF